MVILEEWLHSSYVFISTERATVKAAAGASSEVALTGCQPVLPNATRPRCISCLVRPQRTHPGTVTEYLPRKAIAPGFDLADLLILEAVDPATLGDEPAD